MKDGHRNSTIFPNEVEEKRKQLRKLLGEDTLLRFREDIRAIYLRNTDYDDISSHEKRKLMVQGRKGLDETRDRYISFNTGLDILSLADWGL